MSAVYKRELRAYMNNVYGWLFMAILLLFTGYMMFQNNLYDGAPEFELTLSGSQYALLLLIPILCMRSMAEDRHNKTDMFYLSLPMKTSSVVLGKYLAMLTVYAIPCVILCVYPLVLGAFGCGAFGNDARLVSDLFYKALKEFDYEGDTVMFACGEPFYGTPGRGLNEIRIAYTINAPDIA